MLLYVSTHYFMVHPTYAAAVNVEPCATSLYVADTQRWLQTAVIGLNLCPFAKAVHAKGLVHYAVTLEVDPAGLLEVLGSEIAELMALPAHKRDTSLLILPHAFGEFLDFNDFVGEADALLESLGLEGILQIASFHPKFQFAGTEAADVTNCTNRAPYPTLHLLREDSIDRAVEAFPDAEAIFEANMQVLQALGHKGWEALDVGAHCPVVHPSQAQAGKGAG